MAIEELIQFRNTVPVNGFYWDEDRLRVTSSDHMKFNVRRPLASREGYALCKNFAEIRTPDSALSFANKFGALLNVSDKGRTLMAENDHLWLREAEVMAAIWRLEEARQHRQWKKLSECVVWNDGRAVLVSDSSLVSDLKRLPHVESEQGQRAFDEPKLRLAKSGRPAAALVNHVVRSYLTDTVPVLMWLDKESRYVLRLTPKHLLGAMWIQLADALAGGTKYKRCQGCNRWVELSPRAYRADAEACGPTCRQRLSRKRKLGNAKT